MSPQAESLTMGEANAEDSRIRRQGDKLLTILLEYLDPAMPEPHRIVQ